MEMAKHETIAHSQHQQMQEKEDEQEKEEESHQFTNITHKDSNIIIINNNNNENSGENNSEIVPSAKNVAGYEKKSERAKDTVVLITAKEAKNITCTALLYIIFIAIFGCVIFISRAGEFAFYMTNEIDTVLCQNTNFYNTVTINQYNQWLLQSFIPLVYDPLNLSGKNPHLQNIYLFDSNRVLGAVRLRQLRVRPDSCVSLHRFQRDKDCYGKYHTSIEDKHRYVNWQNFNSSYGNAGAYKPGNTPFWGQFTYYPGGGFIQILGPNITENLEIVMNLQNNNWIDIGTRMVDIEWSVYNININVFCVIRFTAEFPASGGVLTSTNYQTLQFPLYETHQEYVQLVFELLLVLFVFYYIIAEVKEIKEVGRKVYLNSMWNYVEILNYTLFIIVFIIRIYTFISLKYARYNLNPPSDRYMNIYWVSNLLSEENYINAFNIFLCIFKIFKLLDMSPTFSLLFRMLGRGSKDIFYFFLIFVVVFMAFAVAGVRIYGTQISGWQTMNDAMTTLFRGIIEAWLDYPGLYAANRVMAGMFYASYYIIVYFILLNVFIAIINHSYDAVKDEEPPKRIDIDSLAFFWKQTLSNSFYKYRPSALSFLDEKFGVYNISTVVHRISAKYLLNFYNKLENEQNAERNKLKEERRQTKKKVKATNVNIIKSFTSSLNRHQRHEDEEDGGGKNNNNNNNNNINNNKKEKEREKEEEIEKEEEEEAKIKAREEEETSVTFDQLVNDLCKEAKIDLTYAQTITQEIFQLHDRNKNGKLSASELEEWSMAVDKNSLKDFKYGRKSKSFHIKTDNSSSYSSPSINSRHEYELRQRNPSGLVSNEIEEIAAAGVGLNVHLNTDANSRATTSSHGNNGNNKYNNPTQKPSLSNTTNNAAATATLPNSTTTSTEANQFHRHTHFNDNY